MTFIIFLRTGRNIGRYVPLDVGLFLCDERPCSRRYGHTVALRLLLQPCDEDDDYYYFCPFASDRAPVE
jgi:hypothetical protein